MKVSEAIELLSKLPPGHSLEVGSESICCTRILEIVAMGDDFGTVMVTIGDPKIMDDDCNTIGSLSEIIDAQTSPPEMVYAVGDEVDVHLPGGWKTGRVKSIRENYTLSGGTAYEISGAGFVSIANSRSLRPHNDQRVEPPTQNPNEATK